MLADRAQFFRDIPAGPFYGFNRPGAKVSQGIIDNWWRQGMMGGVKAAYDCIKAFSETDFTEDLKKFDVPTLIMHGDDDQIVPIGATRDALEQAGQERAAQGLQGPAPRHVHDPPRRDQRGPAVLPQGLGLEVQAQGAGAAVRGPVPGVTPGSHGAAGGRRGRSRFGASRDWPRDAWRARCP